LSCLYAQNCLAHAQESEQCVASLPEGRFVIDTDNNPASEAPDFGPAKYVTSQDNSPLVMDHVDSVLVGKYPAKAHAAKVVAYLKSKHHNADGVIYLEGQKTRMLEDNDEPQPFR